MRKTVLCLLLINGIVVGGATRVASASDVTCSLNFFYFVLLINYFFVESLNILQE